MRLCITVAIYSCLMGCIAQDRNAGVLPSTREFAAYDLVLHIIVLRMAPITFIKSALGLENLTMS